MKLFLSLMLLFASSAYAQSDGGSAGLTSSFSVPTVEEEQIDLTEYIFGHVKQERVAFVIDTSRSFEKFDRKVLSSIARTILEMGEDQQFTIVFLTRKNIYFNGGSVVNATAENKAAALEFLKTGTRPGGYEPIRQAVEKIRDVNGKIDRIYFFGDGECNPEERDFFRAMKNVASNFAEMDEMTNMNRQSKEFLKLMKVIREYDVPMTSRSGYSENPSVSAERTETLQMLKILTEASKGTLLIQQL